MRCWPPSTTPARSCGAPSSIEVRGEVVAVAGDVWVKQADDRLSRIDGSEGRVVGQVEVANADSMIGAFDPLWVLTMIVDTDGSENEHPVQLIRVDPDLSTTTIELAPDQAMDGETPLRAAAGAGAIWVPIGRGRRGGHRSRHARDDGDLG